MKCDVFRICFPACLTTACSFTRKPQLYAAGLIYRAMNGKVSSDGIVQLLERRVSDRKAASSMLALGVVDLTVPLRNLSLISQPIFCVGIRVYYVLYRIKN